jgi:hypothetical protein
MKDRRDKFEQRKGMVDIVLVDHIEKVPREIRSPAVVGQVANPPRPLEKEPRNAG